MGVDVSEHGYSLVVCDLLVLCAIGLILLSTLEPSFRLPWPSARIRSQVSELALPVEGLNIATVFFVGCLCCLYWEFMHYADKEALWAANKAGGSGGVHHHGQHWELLANKWRAERNLWIAAMSSFVWFAVWSLSVHVSRHRNFVAQKAAEEEPVEQIVFSQFANNLFVLYPVCSAR